MNRPDVKLITVFGLGHRWPASGTWGSLPPVVVAAMFFGVAWVCRGDAGALQLLSVVYRVVLVAILVVFSLACVVQGDGAEARFLDKDPSQAVADETAGQCIPLMFLPLVFSSVGHAVLVLGIAFVSFRVMDIIKPWPARGLQRITSGWGILLDDLFAGVYALIVTEVAHRWMA